MKKKKLFKTVEKYMGFTGMETEIELFENLKLIAMSPTTKRKDLIKIIFYLTTK